MFVDSVVVFLAKNSPGVKWASVTLEEKRAKEAKAPKFDAQNDDPQGIIFIPFLCWYLKLLRGVTICVASMMNMMKQLYQDGDDDM